jgi:hypothetical protein
LLNLLAPRASLSGLALATHGIGILLLIHPYRSKRKKLLDLCSITVIIEEGTPSFHGVENLVPCIEIMAALGSRDGISIRIRN